MASTSDAPPSTSDAPPSTSETPVDPPATKFKFGRWDLDPREVFAETKLSLAIVNFKPVVKGHVLVLPRRVVPRYKDMTQEEVTDMWLLAQKIGQAFEPHHGCSSSTYTIQDGPAAGQTVAHVHVHVMPRREGDFVPNDKIYNEVEANEKEAKKLRMDAEENRPARTMEDMEAEANELRRVLEDFEKGGETN
ncbi:hypothetical protein CLOP_g18934 [Closterium sp. NIES-67]|nr:hypothetical protein CLOP_g18934 [Closterium sp. NIES-67]